MTFYIGHTVLPLMELRREDIALIWNDTVTCPALGSLKYIASSFLSVKAQKMFVQWLAQRKERTWKKKMEARLPKHLWLAIVLAQTMLRGPNVAGCQCARNSFTSCRQFMSCILKTPFKTIPESGIATINAELLKSELIVTQKPIPSMERNLIFLLWYAALRQFWIQLSPYIFPIYLQAGMEVRETFCLCTDMQKKHHTTSYGRMTNSWWSRKVMT